MTKRPVYFMAHMYTTPRGAILYHWENGPLDHRVNLESAREVWDFSARNVARYPTSVRPKVHHVPCGYHPSMRRFRPASRPSFDVAWIGSINDRRATILDGLRRRDMHVIMIDSWGRERNAILAASRVVLNMRFYEDGVFPVLRSAHATANMIPCVAEVSPEIPAWVLYRADFDHLVDCTIDLVRASDKARRALAIDALKRFRQSPLTLPEPEFHGAAK